MFKEYLQAILRKYSPNKVVSDPNDILDLIDFLEDYHNDSLNIQSEFELDNCQFYVRRSPGYKTPCLWLREQNSKKERQFSITNFGNPRIPIQNLVSCFCYIIREEKKRNRQQLANQEGKDFTTHDLWHTKPTTKELVDKFIKQNKLEDKINEIISPNGGGNNTPYLMQNYQYLKQNFIDFYKNEIGNNDLILKLKPTS